MSFPTSRPFDGFGSKRLHRPTLRKRSPAQPLTLEWLEDRTVPSLAFGPPTQLPVAGSPRAVAVADFNRDGNPDLAMASQASGDINILLGNGAGGFGAAQYTLVSQTQGGTVFPAAGDFNGDHFADVAVAFFNTGQVDVLLNAGSGTQKHK